MKPAGLNKSLLHDGMTGIIYGSHHIHTIPHCPAAGRISSKRANHVHPHIAISLIERTQAILVGIEPKRSFSLRQGALHLHPILYPLAEVEFAWGYVFFLPQLLGSDVDWQSTSRQVYCYLLLHQVVNMIKKTTFKRYLLNIFLIQSLSTINCLT